jgi:hypothetical protein
MVQQIDPCTYVGSAGFHRLDELKITKCDYIGFCAEARTRGIRQSGFSAEWSHTGGNTALSAKFMSMHLMNRVSNRRISHGCASHGA